MMEINGSLQVPHDVGFIRKHYFCNNFKSVVRRDPSSFLHVKFSSRGSFWRRDASTLHVSDRLHRPITSIPSRYDTFMCRSCLMPSQGNTIPFLKTAATTVTRSYDTLRGSHVIVKLVPALSILAFALWGVAPLMRHSRNLFLHRSDSKESNWKKSSTHFVMSSYLQPMLLWTGATLICRVLDPVVLPSEASQIVKQRLLTFVRSLSTVLAFAYCLSSLIQQAQKFFMERNDGNDTRNMGFQFAGKAVYTAVWVAAVSLFMELLGFSTQKWLTAGGLGTVLLTLAGREIFTNFLSSAMIHATRPFVVNEWIQTKIEGYEVSGTVEHVGWWSPTIIRGEEREAIHIPNHKFTVNVVRNLTQKTHWRIKTHLAISHLDVNKINSIVADMRKVLAKNPQVEQQRLHRRVFLDNINPENQALLILVSCFVKTSHFEEYLCVKEAILLDLLRVISHHRARLATPIRTVQKVYSDTDIDNIPFSESIYSPPRPANNRPFLLIEPSYKINGDDKSKVQARSTRKSEDQDPKVKADGKVAETPSESKAESKGTVVSPDSKPDPNFPETSTSSKVDSIVPKTAVALDSSKADTKDAMKSTTNLNGLNPVSEGSVQKTKQSKRTDSGDMQQKSSPIDNSISMKTSTSALSPNSPPGGSKANIGAPSSVGKSHAKQDGEASQATQPPPTTRPPLEDNIVLGVALEGSKRTLPIEEGTHSQNQNQNPPTEAHKLASPVHAHNGNGSSSAVGKDKKDGGQVSGSISGVQAGDQRRKER